MIELFINAAVIAASFRSKLEQNESFWNSEIARLEDGSYTISQAENKGVFNKHIRVEDVVGSDNEKYDVVIFEATTYFKQAGSYFYTDGIFKISLTDILDETADLLRVTAKSLDIIPTYR